MSRRKVVLWGASNHALVVADAVRLQGDYELQGFLDDVNPERRDEAFGGAYILGGREQLETMNALGISHLIMAMGNNQARLQLAQLARAKGYELATALHPRAIVAADTRIGAGTVVLAGAIINPTAVLGENVIVNTAAIVEHGCVVEDAAFVNAQVMLAGNVTVGKGALIEIGAIVASNVSIGAHSVIGAGSLVLRDIPEGVLAYGHPAQVIRRIEREASATPADSSVIE